MVDSCNMCQQKYKKRTMMNFVPRICIVWDYVWRRNKGVFMHNGHEGITLESSCTMVAKGLPSLGLLLSKFTAGKLSHWSIPT